MMYDVRMNENIIVSGPFFKCSNPYGDHVTCKRDEYYVSRKRTEAELEAELSNPETSKIRRMLLEIEGKLSIGRITMPHRRKEFVISQLYPDTSFKTLEEAVQFLADNEGKLVFCS